MRYEEYAAFEFAKNLRFLVSKIDDLEKRYLKQNKIDISQRELDYIALIGDNFNKSFTDLIKQEAVSKSTFSNQVKLLESRGLITFGFLEGSKKSKTIVLTEKGQNIYEIYQQIRRLVYEKIVKPYFKDQEVIRTAKTVQKLLASIKKGL